MVVMWGQVRVERVVILLAMLGCGCEALEQQLFTRYSPEVDRAVAAIETHDAGDATAALADYLETGRCKAGSLGTPDSVRTKPRASFDMGLALFQLAERYGQKFGEEPPNTAGTGTGSDPAAGEGQFLKRSQEIDCAQRLVRLIAADGDVALGLRAEAYYLSGNLEFLRGDYKQAVQSYDAALKLYPGGSEDAGVGVGTKAAWNRAIALRRVQDEEEEQEPPPDAGRPPPSDAGSENEQQDDSEQESEDSDSEQSQQEQEQEQQESQQDQQDEGQQQEEPSEEQAENQQQQPGSPQQPEPASSANAHRPSLSQDEQILQMLERAPMLQQELPKIQGRTGRPSMEDK